MTRDQATPYISFWLDDSRGDVLAECSREFPESPQISTLVGWQCGFEPMFVAVRSYLPGRIVDELEATEIAIDFLRERNWFADPDDVEPDYIILPVWAGMAAIR